MRIRKGSRDKSEKDPYSNIAEEAKKKEDREHKDVISYDIMMV